MPHPKLTGGLLLFIFIVGGGAFLLMTCPWILLLIAVPIVVWLVVAFIKLLRK